MDPLKTYKQVNRAHHHLSFGISRMEDIYEKRQGETDAPHRHDFYTVLVVKEARGEHIIDFNEYVLSGSQIFFISPGQVHQVIEFEKSYGFSIVFSSQFLVENNIPAAFVEDLNLFNESGESPPLMLNEDELPSLSNRCEEMLVLNQSDIKFKYDALGSLLKLLLIDCNNLCCIQQEAPYKAEAGNAILRNFKALLNQHYKSWHSATQYAGALHVTADHLNRVLKSLTGKTSKEHIQNRVSLAAKRLLYFSGLSAKEIAYELGFSEPANFSAFFKKCTGLSPSKFLKEHYVRE